MSDTTATNPSTEPGEAKSEKVIYLHGFTKQELYALVDVIKKNTPNPREIAFATTTKNNLKMTIEQMIGEVRSDHNYMEERRQAIKEGRPVPPPPKD